MSQDYSSFETERLLIREWERSDIPALLKISGDPNFGTTFAGLQPGEQSAIDFVNKAIEYRNKLTADGTRGSFRLAVFLKDTNELIGYVGAWMFNPDPQLHKYGFECGTFIAAPYRQSGYAWEAAEGLMKLMREEHGINRFCATVDPENEASIHLLEKSGFILEHRFDDEFLEHHYGRPRLLFILDAAR